MDRAELYPARHIQDLMPVTNNLQTFTRVPVPSTHEAMQQVVTDIYNKLAQLQGSVQTTQASTPTTTQITAAATAAASAVISSSFKFSDAETPVGAIDGSNRTFTLLNPPNPGGSLILVLSGAVLQPGIDYVLAGNSVTLTSTPVAGVDWLLAWYRY